MNVKRLAINGVLLIITCLLTWMLWKTIMRPVDFQETRAKRETEVRNKLTEIAQLQRMYKDMTGSYSSSFDSLKIILTTGIFRIERVQGDKYDSLQVVTVDTVEVPAIDSLRKFIKKMGKNMEIDAYFADISKVPHFVQDAPVENFYIKSAVAQVEGMDSLFQPAFEVGTPIGSYMSDFPEKDYHIYDPDYKTTDVRKIGDISKPNKLSGNW